MMFDFKYLEKSKTLFIESKNLERLKLAVCGLTTLHSSKLPNIGKFYCDDEYEITFYQYGDYYVAVIRFIC